MELVSISEAARRLDRPRSLVRYLLRDRRISTGYAGRAIVIDREGFERLKEALADFESRPTLADTPR